MIINKHYLSYDNILFDNLFEMAFDNKNDFVENINNVGILSLKSDEVNPNNYWLDGTAKFNSGVLIYKSIKDKNISFKIYKDRADYNIFPHFDAKIL